MKTDQQIYDEYATDTRKARRKTGEKTQEFFTPPALVNKMCDKIPESDWADPNKTFLEPSAGNGNFVAEIIRRRISHGVDWVTTLNTLYTLELMQDNVDEMKNRVCELIDCLVDDFDEQEARQIMDTNFVCHDFFTWNFEEWREMTEDEIKKSKKK